MLCLFQEIFCEMDNEEAPREVCKHTSSYNITSGYCSNIILVVFYSRIISGRRLCNALQQCWGKLFNGFNCKQTGKMLALQVEIIQV